jgi:ADP-heptose:LPS heptosyltransferase
VVLETEGLPPYDFHVPLLSIARILGTTARTIPSNVPYLSVDEGRRAAARKALAPAADRRRIGLCWAGSPANSNDRNRSMALALFAPLFELPGITWFSLQAGEAAKRLAETPAAARVIALSSGTQLVDTAALIAELDLIVTVDTGIAHLAGALAKPTWMLIPFAPDWRWRLGREDSPWYPTLRIFRQPRLRDWASVIERLRAELDASVRTEQRPRH